MAEKLSIKNMERDMFRVSIQDGILDIQIGIFLLIFVLPVFLSPYLGDFWSSVVFLPLWFLVILGPRALRKKYIHPRVGTIHYGSFRKKRLIRLNIVILAVNLIALALGIFSFFQFSKIPNWIVSSWVSIILLIGFSLGGYMLETPRIYIYGVLISAAPLIGEYLYQNYGFSHHGFPVTFGSLSAVLVATGLTMLIRLLRKYPAPHTEDVR